MHKFWTPGILSYLSQHSPIPWCFCSLFLFEEIEKERASQHSSSPAQLQRLTQPSSSMAQGPAGPCLSNPSPDLLLSISPFGRRLLLDPHLRSIPSPFSRSLASLSSLVPPPRSGEELLRPIHGLSFFSSSPSRCRRARTSPAPRLRHQPSARLATHAESLIAGLPYPGQVWVRCLVARI